MPTGFLLVILILAIIIVGFSMVTTIYAAVIAAPFVATRKKVIKKALEMSGLKPGEHFYDLGSGTGRVLIIAARDFKASGKGFELSLYHYLLSRINIFLRGLSKSIVVSWKNFYNEDMSDADVIFCWLTPRAFKKLEEKFGKELKSGARVVTFSSPLPSWKPAETFSFSETEKMFLYRK